MKVRGASSLYVMVLGYDDGVCRYRVRDASEVDFRAPRGIEGEVVDELLYRWHSRHGQLPVGVAIGIDALRGAPLEEGEA